MPVLDDILARAARHSAVIALSEGTDPRVAEAARQAADAGIARCILVGDEAQVLAALAPFGGLVEGLSVEDPATAPRAAALVDRLVALRGHKGMTLDMAQTAARDPLVYAALLVSVGAADGTVGGAVHATGDVIRAALQCIGKAPGAGLVSSFFLIEMALPHHTRQETVIFSDCGLNIDPDAGQLAEIAWQSAASFVQLVEREPKIAMLSFSTKGSARHARADKMIAAQARLAELAPELPADGELQFDAAFVPSVGASKAPGSAVAGQANVFIFPDLDSGNIAYKIAQRIGGASAIGPILQGLAKPANDLSRGCSVADVVHLIAVTVLQARSS